MMQISRRGFVGGAFAFGVAGGPKVDVALADAISCIPPNLRFGVVSDVHIGGKPDAERQLEKALRWFHVKNVDAVLCPGDIAHSGLIDELEKFAAVWHKVFGGGCAADGRKVELMISMGNHDVDAWGGRWKSYTEEQMLTHRFCYKDNPEKTMQRLFGQKWEVIWRREVKGYTFIGSQWSSLNPPIEAYMKENAATFNPAKPFFYCQHAHPKGTCHGGSKGVDKGESVRALTPFPNAVAITGHSHCAISDERTVWQGAFTSIGAGCLHEAFGGFEYDNVSAFWHANFRKNLMASLADPKPWGGDAKGGCCELVEVFDDHLVVHRQSVVFGLPIAPAWIVPIPAQRDGAFDFAKRTASRKAQGAVPQFAKDAKIEAKFCPNGHELESAAHKGEACFYVTFPRAKTVKESRVFDYLVEATADGVNPVVRKIIAAGFAYPEECADIPGECLFSAKELPLGKPIRFTVTPRDSFGLAGCAIVGILS
ncbi:MAG: metallophosphoesterase [Kiritimatiellae bacterium]|nr:metallophosphoesterase [Kiritimatiellia bacterium]